MENKKHCIVLGMATRMYTMFDVQGNKRCSINLPSNRSLHSTHLWISVWGNRAKPKTLKKLKENGIEIPIYLSKASLCGYDRNINKNLTDVQNKIINDFDIVLEGPNTDLLSDTKFRLEDYCHFSLLGFEKFSDMWVESLTKK